MREQPNFFWNHEEYLREKQRGKGWCFSIFRPVLIVGYSQGSAMNLIPAIGTYAAIVNTPPPERRWLQITAQSRIGPPSGGLR